jgi:hypothetical protein
MTRAPRALIYPGMAIGLWTVLSKSEKKDSAGARNYWNCRCACGCERSVKTCALSATLRGISQGSSRCRGCASQALIKKRAEADKRRGHGSRFKHGLIKTSEYRIHMGMLARCNNPNNAAYRNYGGRGITVCDRWQGTDGFISFLADMGNRPSGMSLDRIDVNGNYEPSNCRWASAATQAANRRGYSWVETKELTRLRQIAARHGEL